ncbi:unnamed protein product [marine sediment metagenome]|uniref:Uncharacterized protein n=1 Tax=marine sediment metagenome TaxID=412755 RepID=X1G2W1_9ZZZZ
MTTTIRKFSRMGCLWVLDCVDGTVYQTECNRAHSFFADGPKENHHKFCPYCGKRITLNRKAPNGKANTSTN